METIEKIRVYNLDYTIASQEILRKVSIKIPKGRMIGVIGPNGSGKTTLLKHIYRALDPAFDTVFIDGQEIHELRFQESAKKMTVMKQENSSDFEYTIQEMVMMGRTPHRNLFASDTPHDKEIVSNALRYVGMEEKANHYYTELSGGEKQRVMIARSLAQETEIFILDEPTNHLDVHYQWALMDIIKSLQKTVVSVFHELNLAATYCDEIYVLQEGRIVAHGTPTQVLTRQLLQEVFRVETQIIRDEDGQIHLIYKRAI